MARGMTSNATSRSATASETISQLDGVRSLRTMLTAVQTRVLPTIVPMAIREQARTISADAQTGYANLDADTPPPSVVLLLLLLFTVVAMATAR